MRRRIFIGIVLMCLYGGSGGYSQKPDVRPAPVNEVSVAQLKSIIAGDSGNVVLVNAWATWCKPCKEEMPALLRLRKNYQGRPFKLILVSADDIDELDTVVKPMLARFGVDFPTYIVHDSTDDAFITGMDPDWNGALPTSFVYDQRGKLVKMVTGGRTYAQFKMAIAGLLKSPGN